MTSPSMPSAWTLTAHEARPGHELQFDSMVEHGVSLARALLRLQLHQCRGLGTLLRVHHAAVRAGRGPALTLQLRLLRAARAFLDPELQSGAVTPGAGLRGARKGCHAEPRFRQGRGRALHLPRARARPTAISTATRACCRCARRPRTALGAKFDQKKFHDFILGQGLLPPDLMRKAVLEEFVPASR